MGYVPVDSDSIEVLDRLTPTRTGEGGRIGVLLDEDDVVNVRDDRGRLRPYGLGVPTMSRRQELVAGWEDYGTSLVVLDGLENARPYPATSQDVVAFPNGITITRRAVNEWRALEMSGLAKHAAPRANCRRLE